MSSITQPIKGIEPVPAPARVLIIEPTRPSIKLKDLKSSSWDWGGSL
jgi:hypothetical protein